MTVADGVLMGSDATPERHHKAQGFLVNLRIEKPAGADRIFNALAEGGTVTMPIQETFWAT